MSAPAEPAVLETHPRPDALVPEPAASWLDPPRAIRMASHVAVWLAVGLPTLVDIARGWSPIADDAAISARSYQVLTRHPPLVGYGTTTAHAGGQMLHDLGPLLFWLTAIPVRLDPLHGVLWGAALVGAVALSIAIEAVWSTGRWIGCLLIALAAVDYLALLPAVMDNLAWNAYFPIPLLIASIALAWVVGSSSLGWWPILVAVGSVAAQAHLIYAPAAVILVIGAPCLALAQRGRPERYRWLFWGLMVALACWLAPLIQNFGAHGNLAALSNSEHGQAHMGISFGLQTVAYLAAPPPIWLRAAPTSFYSVIGSIGANGPVVGIVTLVALAVIAGVAWWKRNLKLSALALVALGSTLGVLVAFAQIPSANSVSVNYVLSMVWAVSMLVWTVAVWTTVLLVRAAWAKRSLSAPARFPIAPWRLAAPALLAVVLVVGLVVATDTNRTLSLDITAMSTVSLMSNHVEQVAPRGPVAVFVGSSAPGYLAALEIDEGIAWRLFSAHRDVGVFGAAGTYTGLKVHGVAGTMFLFVIDDDERLVTFGAGHCQVLDAACVHRIQKGLAAHHYAPEGERT